MPKLVRYVRNSSPLFALCGGIPVEATLTPITQGLRIYLKNRAPRTIGAPQYLQIHTVPRPISSGSVPCALLRPRIASRRWLPAKTPRRIAFRLARGRRRFRWQICVASSLRRGCGLSSTRAPPSYPRGQVSTAHPRLPRRQLRAHPGDVPAQVGRISPDGLSGGVARGRHKRSRGSRSGTRTPLNAPVAVAVKWAAQP